MTKKTRISILAAVLAALVLSACGGGSEHDGHSAGGGSGGSEAGAMTDAMFVNSMIPHHEGAVEMAEIARERGEHPEIRKLASAIVTSQEKEIATMTPIREELAAEHGDARMEGEHGLHMETSDREIDELKTAKEFDRTFIDMMVPHHESALKMAQEQLAKGKDETLRALAQDIIDSQKREIDQMRAWREQWYGSAGASGGASGHGH